MPRGGGGGDTTNLSTPTLCQSLVVYTRIHVTQMWPLTCWVRWRLPRQIDAVERWEASRDPDLLGHRPTRPLPWAFLAPEVTVDPAASAAPKASVVPKESVAPVASAVRKASAAPEVFADRGTSAAVLEASMPSVVDMRIVLGTSETKTLEPLKTASRSWLETIILNSEIVEIIMQKWRIASTLLNWKKIKKWTSRASIETSKTPAGTQQRNMCINKHMEDNRWMKRNEDNTDTPNMETY